MAAAYLNTSDASDAKKQNIGVRKYAMFRLRNNAEV